MEGLSGLLSSLGQNNNWMKLLTGGMMGAGEIGNIMEMRKRNQILDILNNPKELARRAAQLTQPLDQGLVQGVQNRVQGDMASRGLAQAPGIFAATESQDLAPYYQKNQQTALDTVMRALSGELGAVGKTADMSKLMSLFTQQWNKPDSGGSAYNGLTADQISAMYGGPASAPTTDSTVPNTLG